ncbi:MFS transporter [Nocardioides sp. BP30]|uniref:MFS transporter n=1 Tax=Nocardioides sp. BP30 TaxID=3036374 RepID=UPI0024695EDC|nr:MFS transporter [Nocardioides sp. BP30]WGL50338.1 MFS transporter [Nocardioides sp. BP30]
MDPAPASRAWLVWGVGVAVYLLAVFNRSSLAVAGLIATDRFHISAGQLSTFAMLQLLVYAGMQIPVGLMVDRFGSRTVLTGGLLVMSAAQTGFALATTYPEALIARVFVGMGDAMTFICVLRLVSAWFPLRRIPLVTQLTGNVGQLGALFAAVPMTWALSHLGWHAAYLIAAGAGPVLLVPMLLFLRDSPGSRHQRGTALSLPDLGRNLRSSWAQPGTRLGFWVHFTTPFSATMLALLWGYPFFVEGEHLSDGAAGSLLSLIVVANIVAGPVLGWLVGRHPWHRSSLALVIVAAIVLCWTVVLLWPGHAPYWLLALTVFVAGCGGPGSMIGFDVGRTSNPGHRLASASGIINVAGFVAALITIVAVGFILDWRTPGGGTDYTDAAFHWAMSFQYLLWALGVAMILRQRRVVRARVQRASVDSGDSMVRAVL